METGQVFHARFGDVCVLKFVGSIGFTSDWTFPLSKALRAFLNKLFVEKDFENIVVDLTEATGIDSTNLGLLAEVARFSLAELGHKPTLMARDGRVLKALRITGFDALFSIFDIDAPIRGNLEVLPDVPDSEIDVARMILTAHQTLADMNEENRKRFKNVVDTLEADIVGKESSKPKA